MTDDPRSSFWQRVGEAAEGGCETGGRLEAATRAACGRTDPAVAFRRNRELVDVRGRFRCYAVAGAPHVAKIVDAEAASEERLRARRVHDRIAADGLPLEVCVPAVVPLPESAALVTPDRGFTMAEYLTSGDPAGSLADPIELLDMLLGAGIVWHGFAPRNIFPALSEDRFPALIDLEEATVTEPGRPRVIDARTFRFWCLDWCLPGMRPVDVDRRFADVVRRHLYEVTASPLDRYETCYQQISGLSPSDSQQKYVTITRISCTPLPERLSGSLSLTPWEITGLLPDILPTSQAVSANVLLARHRCRNGEQAHAELLASVEREIQAALRIAGAGNRLDPDLDVLQRHISERFSVLLDSAPGLRIPDGGAFSV